MMWRQHLLSICFTLVFAYLVPRAQADSAKSEKVINVLDAPQSRETLDIRNKLATAEGRVSDLISRLDSVSDDASRAKSEIHNTLMEVWKVVDLLGRDRCGEVVDKIRRSQKKAESKITEQQDEINSHLKTIEELKLKIAKTGDSLSSLRTEINAERTRREAIETEARELRDKLHWASAVANETEKYELVAERLQNLLVVVTERTQLLSRISTMVSESHGGFMEWRSEIESLTKTVRDAERDFSGGYQSAAVDGLRRQATELEKKLKDALKAREILTDEKNTLRRSIEALQNRATSAGMMFTGGGGKTSGQKDKIFVRTDNGWGTIGVISLCLMSLCTGAVGAFILSSQREDKEDVAEPKQGFTPTTARTSPGFQGNASTPLQHVNSASRTPGSKGSTPRRY